MQPQLPPELLDHIFLFLRNSSDLVSLRACTRVNSLFCTLAEPHLYYHLTLTDHILPGSPTPTPFSSPSAGLRPSLVLQLLVDHPHIAAYVRSLDVSIHAHAVGGTITAASSIKYMGDEDTARVLLLLDSYGAWELLTDRPHIAGYIRSLTICLVRVDIDALEDSEESLGDRDLARVLPLLPHLDRVVLEDHDSFKSFTMYPMEWNEMDSALLDALMSTLAGRGGKGVREIAVCRMTPFPLEVLDGLPDLEKVELVKGSYLFDLTRSHVSACQASVSATPPDLTPRACLKSLTLQHCAYGLQKIILAWLYEDSNLKHKPDISKLTHLKATVSHSQEYMYLPYILSACQHSLEVLELDPGGEANLFYDPDSPKDHPVLLHRPPSLIGFPMYPHLFAEAPAQFVVDFAVTEPGQSSITVSLPSPFSLNSLQMLRHLILKLEVEGARDLCNDRKVAYNTPFEWLRRVCGELSGAPPLPLDGSMTSLSLSSDAAADLGPGHRHLVLEQLTLEISFYITPTELRKVSFAPLASVLSSLSSSVPSLQRVVIRAINATACIWVHGMEHIEPGSGWIVRVLEEDKHLAPLTAEGKGLLRILDG